MRYTKAHVLATVDANHAIHHNDKPLFEKRVPILDGRTPSSQSTTGAYEADE
jgi:hypothetical protein